VATTTITRLARTDDKAASALSLDLASKIVTVLDCEIEDLLDNSFLLAGIPNVKKLFHILHFSEMTANA